MIKKRYQNSIKNAKARLGADCGSDYTPVVINIKTTLKVVKRTYLQEISGMSQNFTMKQSKRNIKKKVRE